MISLDKARKVSIEPLPGIFPAVLTFVRVTGKTVSHSFAKEALMGFAGAEVDKLAETKGMDYIDRDRVKDQAQRQAGELYDNQYGDMNQYDP